MRNLPLLPRIAAVLAMVLVSGLAATTATASERLTTYKLPAEFALPNDMTIGPDGATWVTDSSLGRIWRIAANGRIKSYELGQQPGAIAVADGSMWVADAGGDAIHRVETDGSSVRHPLDAGSFPISITAGPDGALWFTEGRDDEIGRITLDGEVTEYPLPTAGAFAGDITAGPDGALWFSEAGAGKLGRITTAGVVTEFDVPGDEPLPGSIVPGPDGALYLAERNDNVISRVTTDGVFTDEYALPREFADPVSMVEGVDGALWISEFSSGVVSRMTFDGTFTRAHRIPGGFNDRLISAPDGALWVAQGSRGQVSRLDVGLDYPVTAEGTTFEARAGKPVNATVATFTDADPNARARDYDVTINWGDGDRSSGTVERRADGSFAVRGKHAYARQGSRKVVVRITDGVGKGLDAKVTSWAIVRS
jgi:virginiamycin B lyase